MENGTVIFLVLFLVLAAVFFIFGSGSYFYDQEISRTRLFQVAIADAISLFGSTILGVIYHRWRKEQDDTEETPEDENAPPYTGD